MRARGGERVEVTVQSGELLESVLEAKVSE